MPKGSPPNIIHAKTWSGKVLPGRTKAQLTARTKNMMREAAPKDGDAKIRATKRSVRSDASVARLKKMRAPVGKGGR